MNRSHTSQSSHVSQSSSSALERSGSCFSNGSNIGLACALPSLRSSYYPWYLIWLLPLAYARRSAIYPVAIAFPIVGLLLSDVYFTWPLVKVGTYVVLAIAAAVIATLDRRSASSADGMRAIGYAERIA